MQNNTNNFGDPFFELTNFRYCYFLENRGYDNRDKNQLAKQINKIISYCTKRKITNMFGLLDRRKPDSNAMLESINDIEYKGLKYLQVQEIHLYSDWASYFNPDW